MTNERAAAVMILAATAILAACSTTVTNGPASSGAQQCPGLEGTWSITDDRTSADPSTVCAAGDAAGTPSDVTIARTGPSAFTWTESIGGQATTFPTTITPHAGDGGGGSCTVAIDQSATGSLRDLDGKAVSATVTAKRTVAYSWTPGPAMVFGFSTVAIDATGNGLPCHAAYALKSAEKH